MQGKRHGGTQAHKRQMLNVQMCMACMQTSETLKSLIYHNVQYAFHLKSWESSEEYFILSAIPPPAADFFLLSFHSFIISYCPSFSSQLSPLPRPSPLPYWGQGEGSIAWVRHRACSWRSSHVSELRLIFVFYFTWQHFPTGDRLIFACSNQLFAQLCAYRRFLCALCGLTVH